MRVFYKYSISVFRSGCVDGSRASMLHGDRRSMLGPFRWQSVRSDQSIDFTCSTGLASDGTRMLDFQRRGRNFWRILGGRSQQRHRSVVAAGSGSKRYFIRKTTRLAKHERRRSSDAFGGRSWVYSHRESFAVNEQQERTFWTRESRHLSIENEVM